MNDNHTAAVYDARVLEAELAALFYAYPELADDSELRADTLEGSTNIHDTLARLVAAAQDAKHMAAAVTDRIGELQGRKSRYERRNEAMRALLFRLLKLAGLPRIQLPDATLSVGKGRDRVEITDVALLPDNVVRLERVPDKRAVGELLKAGPVAGAEMVAGGEVLTVRVA